MSVTANDANESAGRDRWLVSYADLVTLLLALFVVLYASADKERARAIAHSIAASMGETQPPPAEITGGNGVLPGAAALVAERGAIERTLASNKTFAARARLTQTERGLVVSLAEAGFFAPGEVELSADAFPIIDALADALRDSRAPVRIEGHTDTTPISTSRFPSNWELSTARATAVLARLVARGITTERLSASGFGGERPAADNGTPAGRALNRRVDLVILSQQ